MNSKTKKALQQAQALEKAGKPQQALGLYRQIAAQNPGLASIQNAIARLGQPQNDPLAGLRNLYRQGQFEAVLKAAETLQFPHRGSSAASTIIGAAEMALGRPARAEISFRAALKSSPERPAMHNNLGMALRDQDRLEDAKAAFEEALKLDPKYGEALNGLGAVLRDLGDAEGAEKAFLRARKSAPQNPEIWTNLGNIHQQRGQLNAAILAYKTALSLAPNHAGAHYNYGLVLKLAGNLAEAVEHYNQAILSTPNFAAAHNNLGVALQSLGQLPAAETSLRKAIVLTPEDAEAHNNLGTVLQKMGRLDEAVAAYDQALKLNPEHATAQAQRLHQMTHMCDWHAFADLAEITEVLGIEGDEIPPLTVLAMEDAPERQKARAERYAEASFDTSNPLRSRKPAKTRPERLRIGYFSADYRNHPVARLIAGMIAAHDRDRFELFGYSFGPDTQDELRDELRAQFDQFTDIRAIGDVEAVRVIGKDKLDIAIDLTCYTQHSRTGLFAKRIAPVQINYLGYPGTSGAQFMDYIAVDPVLVPSRDLAFTSEALFTMPHCYQPNDNRREVPADKLSRSDHGLPEDGVVLCCFNSNYKITPREFGIWMRVLEQIEGSVLWLLDSNGFARDNLCRQAREAGIDDTRLIFAPRASNTEHLARHQHADLFLDTFAYNAHTTGSDALWMGVPVVTFIGRQFAARVCASLLTSMNVPELITETEEAYEALILELASSTEKRSELRQKIERNRPDAPLFDTSGYTRAFEAGLDIVSARWRAGKAPADIQIPST